MATQWKFNSLVCFDLETSGLPQYNNPVRITEISLVGVVRAHIDCNDAVRLPRITHKLSFSVSPNKRISDKASEISGLYNDMLEPIKPWLKESAQMVLSFLRGLPAPICLVAHNGYRFDFPILKQHFDLVQLSLPEDVLCVDSLPAFKNIMPEVRADALIEELKTEMECDNEVLLMADKEEQNCNDGQGDHRLGEKTPDTKFSGVNANPLLGVNKGVRSSGVPHLSKAEVRRCLFPTKPFVSYKLAEIHRQLFNIYPDQSHNAEEDALTLLKCILKTYPKFSEWANENCQSFSVLFK